MRIQHHDDSKNIGIAQVAVKLERRTDKSTVQNLM